MAKKQILVVGAGVIGLTTALLASEQLGEDYDIHLISKDLPGDNDSTFYTSPKAGAHWISSNKKTHKDWHLATYKKLKELAKIPETFIKSYPLYMGEIVPDGKEIPPFEEPWFVNDVEDYQFLGTDAKFPGVYNLYTFKSYTISTNYYLGWLLGKLRAKGVSIQRYTLKTMEEAKSYVLPNGLTPDTVINSTALGYNFLGDSFDPKLVPVKGHVLIVENNLPYQVTFDHPYPIEGSNPGEFLMLFPRAEGGGVLGGIYNRDFLPFDTSIDQEYVTRLVEKVRKHLPELLNANGQLRVAKHVIGFRPERIGGARIEFEGGILHNYGSGNSGYIESFGCAEQAIALIRNSEKINAKL